MRNHPTPQAIREQLARIVASGAFARCRRMQRFLTFVVEEALAGRESELGEYGIGVAVFDRGTDFEPAVDPIVRNDARRLRTKLLEYYREAGWHAADAVSIEIPKGGYAPVFSPLQAARPAERAPEGPTRVAVLPFEALTNEPEAGLCARMLRVSLSAALAHIEGVEAVAMGYEGPGDTRVSHTIEGVVVRAGEHLRAIVHLAEVSTGTQLWSGAYDFTRGETLEVQQAISASVLGDVIAELKLEHPKQGGLFLVA